ncbi:histidine kinase [Nonomuraea rosea]|uniref:histidine kinase n=1 Tax=Nonomuraea rosea TaxID=638574 RepID=A0ABP6Z5P3_9ACTN
MSRIRLALKHRPVRPTRFTLVSLGLAVLLAIALHTVTHGGPAIAALLICLSLTVTRFPLRQSLPIGLLAVAGLLVAGMIGGGHSPDLTLLLAVCLVFLTTYAAKQRKATRAAEAREAVLAERARIAREIHDILAHSLSAQLVHLEGAKLLLRAERTDEALDRVTHARNLAKSGLEEARRAVSALRDDPPALPVALRTLAEEFESTTHRPCTLRVSGPAHRLAPQTELALLRTTQEALTNVRRHAPGSPAAVELAFDPAGCDLRITNPASAEPGAPGGGYGLVGMRERAELLGGTLSAGERDGGFLVHLKVPT